MRKALASIILCVLVVALGMGVTVAGQHFRSLKLQAEAAVPPPPAKIAGVHVKVLKPEVVEDRLVLTGTVEPWEDVLLSSEARGKIEWQGIDEGQSVEKGQELVRIDTSLIQAQLDQAKTQEKLANQELQRLRSLSDKGVTTPQNLDQAVAQRDTAEASRRVVEIQLDKSMLRAPIAGVVDKRFSETGEFTDMGSPLIRLVQTQKVKVKIGIPERDILFFKPGDKVTVTLDAVREKKFEGQIHKIATTAEASTLTFVSEVEVDNPDGLIKPGMIARVSLLRKTYPDSIAVPMFAILSIETQRFVFVEENGTAHIRPIEIGVIQEDSVQASSGLKPGDRLIVTGQRELQEGDPVDVMEVIE